MWPGKIGSWSVQQTFHTALGHEDQHERQIQLPGSVPADLPPPVGTSAPKAAQPPKTASPVGTKCSGTGVGGTFKTQSVQDEGGWHGDWVSSGGERLSRVKTASSWHTAHACSLQKLPGAWRPLSASLEDVCFLCHLLWASALVPCPHGSPTV